MRKRYSMTLTRRTCGSGLLFLAMAAWGSAVQAQTGETVEVDALQCWRRVGKNAVHVGERFDMMLTCSVVETDTARAVADLAWLEPETLTVSPFEVLDGERYRDILRGPRRFFQYRYALRIIGEDHFGLDVELPPLEVKYRIERALDATTAVEGRELTYVLPSESVRVLALVPAGVTDIRELPGETFGDAEARLFRANASSIVATTLGIFAAAVLLIAAVRARREWRGAAAAADTRVSEWRVARTALGELSAVQVASQTEGWTMELVTQALASFRIAASLALGLPMEQVTAVDTASETDRENRLRVRPWLLGGAGALVSSSVTPRRVDAAFPSIRTTRPDDAGLIQSIREGLVIFTTAHYGSSGELQTDALSTQIDAGVGALRTLSTRTLPPVRFVSELRRSLKEWVTARWPR